MKRDEVLVELKRLREWVKGQMTVGGQRSYVIASFEQYIEATDVLLDFMDAGPMEEGVLW